MMDEQFNIIQLIAIIALPLLFAITVHEVAHGWAALQFGDSTAKNLGRLTLNPIKHIDLVGTVILPILLLALGGFLFGWAKPVPVSFKNLHNPRRDMGLVALAGPMANLLMAVGWALVAKVGLIVGQQSAELMPLFYMGEKGIQINIMLMVLNLLPILPLDGGRILHSILPPEWAMLFGKSEAYGLFILVLLLASGILGYILIPIIQILYQWFFIIFII